MDGLNNSQKEEEDRDSGSVCSFSPLYSPYITIEKRSIEGLKGGIIRFLMAFSVPSLKKRKVKSHLE